MLPFQEFLDSLTLPDAASYLIFANVQLVNTDVLIAGTCQLVDESDNAILASDPYPTSAGNVQMSLTATDTVAAETPIAVTCAAGSFAGTTIVMSAGIAAIQF